MKKYAFALLALCASLALAGDKPPSAAELLGQAQKTATSSGRTVFVGFHASWCGWCKKMEKVLTQPEIKAIWDRHFVSVWLVVLESAEKKELENAGAMDVLIKNGGAESGIPFFFFTDAKGRTLVNSLRPGKDPEKPENVGCPYEPEEIGHFMKMLDKSAPKMSSEERAKIRSAFEALKKADKKDE